MGKGIALMFKEAFPSNTEAYERACRNEQVQVGKMFVTRNPELGNPRWIINFPTKRHWRNPSKLTWIRDGLSDLVRVIVEKQIRSIALPPLGCGAGGLDWEMVRKEIEGAFADLTDVEVIVYAPTNVYQNSAKRAGVEFLTTARALIAELIRRYCILGIDCTNLEVQKLAWFLNRSLRDLELDDVLSMEFKANKYGPYADQLRHLLNLLDGSYLHSDKRLSDAGPFDVIVFEDSKKAVVADFLQTPVAKTYLPALERAAFIIDGFESPLGMELLATVDWLLNRERCEPTLASIRQGIQNWPGGKTAAARKNRLFDDRLLGLAIDRLTSLN
jgi:O-acetyl-ADP-ribose deacetylase (regulator of RNase III)